MQKKDHSSVSQTCGCTQCRKQDRGVLAISFYESEGTALLIHNALINTKAENHYQSIIVKNVSW